MDKFNVIEPKDNLAELNAEISQWLGLPYEMRMRSDDACMMRYDCTNIELYNKIKAKIMFQTGILDPSNLVSESVSDFDKMEDIQNRYTMTDMLNTYPNICIISPNMTSAQLISTKNSYDLLRDRDKAFSNDYSNQIWGYNVINMYHIVKDIIHNKEAERSMDQDNLVKHDSLEDLQEMYYDHMMVTNDRTGIANAINESKSSRINPVLEAGLNCDEFDFILSEAAPLLNHREIYKAQKNMNLEQKDLRYEWYDNYAKHVIENADNQDELIAHGWIPGINPGKLPFMVAKQKEIETLKSSPELLDIKKSNIQNFCTENDANIFILFTEPDTANKVMNDYYFTHCYISFSPELNILYKVNLGHKFDGFELKSWNGLVSELGDTGRIKVFTTIATKGYIDRLIKLMNNNISGSSTSSNYIPSGNNKYYPEYLRMQINDAFSKIDDCMFNIEFREDKEHKVTIPKHAYLLYDGAIAGYNNSDVKLLLDRLKK
jgi:hypothetical protein